MTEDSRLPPRPHPRWLPILLGAAPNLVVLGYLWRPRMEWFTYSVASLDALPFVLYSKAELIIVPATLLLTLVVVLIPRSRPLALWLLVGTLSGATLVLLALARAAVVWA